MRNPKIDLENNPQFECRECSRKIFSFDLHPHYKNLCRDCAEERVWRRRRRRAGLSKFDHARMMRFQNDTCAICQDPSFVLKIDMGMDGFPRGLLCHRCLTGIGFLQNDPRTLERALEYVRCGGTYGVRNSRTGEKNTLVAKHIGRPARGKNKARIMGK